VAARRRIAVLLVLVLSAVPALAGSAAAAGPDPVDPIAPAPVELASGHDHADHDHDAPKALTKVPAENRRRGLVYDGLTLAEAGSPCAGGFEVRVAGRPVCTHGPDPAPPGVDLLADPAPLPEVDESDVQVRAQNCIGDGTSGPRVQMLYVRAEGSPDNSAASIPQLKLWADDIDEIVRLSAQETGGDRSVRWATDPRCVPTVISETVQASHLQFTDMVAELSGRGYDDPERKYLIWFDADPGYCGLGTRMRDSRPGQENHNNGVIAQFASASRDCWSAFVGAHEMMHNMGAVQADAPNATDYGHCEDDADLMCYADGATTVMRNVCPSSHEERLDCNHDDYFHTAPPAGSYLATHWNTATSRFLHVPGVDDPPTAPSAATATATDRAANVTWTTATYEGPRPVLGYTVTATPGGASASVGAGARTAVLSGLTNRVSYTIEVRAVSQSGPSAATRTNAVAPSPIITTVAGTADSGSTGDGGAATAAQLTEVRDVAVDSAGNRYVATADRIRMINPAGVISTVVGGPTPTGTTDGTPPLQLSVTPSAVTVGPGGVLYWSDAGRHVVRKLQGGTVTTVAGTLSTPGFAGDGALATAARLNAPQGLSVTAGGEVYIADSGNSRIRRVAAGTTPSISTVAGSGVGFAGDGGAPTSARLNLPRGVTVATDGTMYIADTANNRVRRVASGTITTVAGNGTVSGSVSTVPTSASVRSPMEIVVTTDGFIVAEPVSCVVRQVAAGVLHTITGSGTCGFAGDGGPATVGRIGGGGLALDSGGRLLIADGPNHRVRMVATLGGPAAAAVPSAAVAVVATPGHSKVTVSWVPPGNGGSPITGYRVTVTPGGAVVTAVASATSVIVPNLTPGTRYTFSVAAVNLVGTGASTTGAAVPTRGPTAPTPVSATGGDGKALVMWGPATRGTGPITGYRIVSSVGGAVTVSPAGASRVLFPALLTTTSYRFTVSAVDADGVGPASVLTNAVTPSAKAPFLSNEAFVRQVFKDMYSRPATSTEVSTWSTSIGNGTRTRAQLVSLLMDQPYWSGSYAPVGRLYTAYFRRLPDKGGLDYWVNLHRNRYPLGDISTNFAASVEFRDTYGTLTNAAFVQLIYSNVLGRAPDAGGLAYWTGILNQGHPRGVVMTGFSESPEYIDRMANETTVVMLYRGLLADMPTQARFDDAVARVDAGLPVATLIDELLLDPAYAARITR
jgi:hypothetical protein